MLSETSAGISNTSPWQTRQDSKDSISPTSSEMEDKATQCVEDPRWSSDITSQHDLTLHSLLCMIRLNRMFWNSRHPALNNKEVLQFYFKVSSVFLSIASKVTFVCCYSWLSSANLSIDLEILLSALHQALRDWRRKIVSTHIHHLTLISFLCVCSLIGIARIGFLFMLELILSVYEL